MPLSSIATQPMPVLAMSTALLVWTLGVFTKPLVLLEGFQAHMTSLCTHPWTSSFFTSTWKPVYERLADKQLLQRCVSGRTQNANECLHSLVWARCSKDNFASRNRVTFAVTTAAGEFNFGSYSSLNTLEFYGFQVGDHTARLGEARLRKRVQNSLKYKQDRSKKRRGAVRAAKQKRQEELVDQEGGPAYAAGQF